MDGLMMDYALTIPKILDRANRLFWDKQIVSDLGHRTHRYGWGDFHGRVLRAMDMLRRLGVKPGDRVATFAWNHYRHLELYFAVPCVGAVLHTLNLRLAADQLVYIVNHAADRVIFVDDSLLPLLEPMAGGFSTVEQYVVMRDAPAPLETALAPASDYETLMAAAEERETFPDIAENDACGLCYTSGTTGNPKGVLYSHRGTYLHTLAACMTDMFAIAERDVLLPIVPMFHANAWGQPYVAAMTGCTMVFAGSNVQPEHIVQLIEQERVTLAFGVPTIWNGLLQYLERHEADLSTVRAMVVGGSAVPRAMIETFDKRYGIRIIQGWGMTEMSPLGSTARLTSRMDDWPEAERYAVLSKQGMIAPNVEARIRDDAGNDLPWDGKAVGELLVRGPSVVKGYYNDPQAGSFTADGWFHTGDVASIDERGFIAISDRTKDLIKSGGEWISSVEMENAIMACSGVLEAAVVARPDERWDERPVAFVVPRPGDDPPQGGRILETLSSQFARWQLPAAEDVRIIDEIPKTSVGKFDKKVLRGMVDAG